MTLKKYWFLLKTCFVTVTSLTAYWPKNWRETEQLLMECGYKEPKEFTICLDQSHPCHWDRSSYSNFEEGYTVQLQ